MCNVRKRILCENVLGGWTTPIIGRIMPSRNIIILSENFYYIIGNLIYYIIGKFVLHYW